jgi:KipI family sensor histidine kinase inhibitor
VNVESGLGPSLSRPAVEPFGDAAVLIELGGAPGLATSIALHAIAEELEVATVGRPGWEPPVPAATSILVPVDPVEPGAAEAVTVIRDLLEARRANSPGPGPAPGAVTGAAPGSTSRHQGRRRTPAAIVEVAVRYGGEDGPDLEAVASMTGLTPRQVIDLHASPAYTALFLGFAPGFAYLGPLPDRLVLQRRAEPRPRVRAGSVAIAGPQTAVYSVDSPGGWWILGTTSTRFWDPHREPPALLRPGDRVRFVPEVRRR